MKLFRKKDTDEIETRPRLRKKRKWLRALLIFGVLVLLVGGFFMYKTGSTLSQISTKDGFFKSLWNTIPVVSGNEELKGKNDGQINILLLGMRGNNMPGGGLLADTIMVAAIRPEENKVALISIPRDLYVEDPERSQSMKINSIHAHYESKEAGQGLDAMKKVVENVTGLPIHYASSLNFTGFKELVDAVGGVDIYLDKPFSEPSQFEGENALDFSLPAGKNHLDGQKALFFVRARFASSDFERARRQQQVLIALKDKLLSMGTLTNFSKISNILDIVGTNLRADMDVSEMKKAFELSGNLQDPKISQKVFDTSTEGLLISGKGDTPEGKSYILLPAGGNFDKIRQVCQNIFNN